MVRQWVLEGRKAVEVADPMEWGRWWETAERRVARTVIDGDCFVSTVFLGLDHNFGPVPHEPLLFETMVFRGGVGEECERYGTWEEAEVGHARMVVEVMGG